MVEGILDLILEMVLSKNKEITMAGSSYPKNLVKSKFLKLNRYNGSKSTYSTDECKEIVEALGHSVMYDYLYDTEDKSDIYKIQELHKMLYQYAPYPEAGGVYRQDNNFETGAQFETVDYSKVVPEIIALDKPVKELIDNVSMLTNAEVILAAAKIHHRITVIHPFVDGNGRWRMVFDFSTLSKIRQNKTT